jgi:chaperonin cofactor prefoldin
MGTTMVEIDTATLESQHDALRTAIQRAQSQLRDAQQKLEAAREERGSIAESVARGRAPESDAALIRADIESLELRIDGLTRAIAADQPKLAALSGELTHRVHRAALAQRRKDFEELKADAFAQGQAIKDQLRRLSCELLPAFDELRLKLTHEYVDLDGREAAIDLRRIFTEDQGVDALWRELVDRGKWKPLENGLSLTINSLVKKP